MRGIYLAILIFLVQHLFITDRHKQTQTAVKSQYVLKYFAELYYLFKGHAEHLSATRIIYILW